MSNEFLSPARIEGPSPSGAVRQILPTKGHGGEPPLDVQQPLAGNTADPQIANQAVHELAQVVEPYNVSMKYSRDAETGTIVVEMIDTKFRRDAGPVSQRGQATDSSDAYKISRQDLQRPSLRTRSPQWHQ